MNTTHKPLKVAFFGTPQIAVWVLEELEHAGIVPALLVTNPDAPQGRKNVLTPPPVKVWGEERHIPVLQPESLRDSGLAERLSIEGFNLFIVAAYGKIVPKTFLDIPTHGVLNVHPSLLPHYRGASPIRSAILNDDRDTGVTIMLMDEEMDHGPILAQEHAAIAETEWPIPGNVLDEHLARHGGALLARTIPLWIGGDIAPQEQDHGAATYCAKITRADGEINLDDDPYQNLLKIRAYDGWPGTFFFTEKGSRQVRIKITNAELATDGSLQILRVIPEGKKEMDYTDWARPKST
ncbi:methionyl-tRNA formyltransferase [Candidatus Kaiserbacteria bacterium]|nr:methionyl-tRNA formyltransferase [Candidatus Kaiserbacteria bacterium]